METNKSNNNVLLVVAAIILTLMMGVMLYQNNVMTKMRDLLEKTDTIVSTDTIFLEKVVRDTIPQVQTKHVFITDTLWRVEGDSVVGEPQLVTLVKKKSATN